MPKLAKIASRVRFMKAERGLGASQQHKPAEAALRESEERLRSLITATSHVAYRMSADWGEMRQLDGRGFLFDTNIPRQSWLADYIHPDDQPQVLAAIHDAIQTKSVFELEHRVRRADGSLGWTLSRAVPLLDDHGEIREWFGVARDMTARKRIEEALGDSQARLTAELEAARRLHAISTELLHEQRPEQLYDRIVEAAAMLMQSDAASMQEYVPARSALRLLAARGFDQQAATVWEWITLNAASPCGQALAHGSREIVFDADNCDYIVGTGNHDHFRRLGLHGMQSTPLISRSGRLLGMISTHWRQPHEPSEADLRLFDVLARQAADLIERVQAQEALRESEARLRELNHVLEERIRDEVLARENAQAHAAHAQRMQALGQLAAGIAHDFNNVLQTVQSSGTLIAKRAEDASMRKSAAEVLEAADRGASITRRLLAFARHGELRAERIDLAGLLDGLRDVLTQTLGSPITVRIINDEFDLPAAMADRGQLETVLVNLAINARDAMPRGGTLTLAVIAEEVTVGRIHRTGLEPGRYVRLSVTDTGTGMDQATLARAMEPFFSTKAQDKGTGLGLSMAKGFAEQSGGVLAIDSAPGRGTTVTLWLPVADEQQQVAQAMPGLAPVAGLTRRILLVEDEDLVRETLAANLEECGFSVLTAGSGAEALVLLGAGKAIDAIVSDLSMPGMDGLALIRAIHQQRPNLPAILLTGFAGEASQLVTGTGSPGFSLLRKPVTTAHLVDRIEATLTAHARD
jgi:signal transduction histidine kinase/ActR/RegA family two-component response regulator